MPRGPNFFNFMHWLGKNRVRVSFSHPPLELVPHLREILDPPTVRSISKGEWLGP